MRKNINVLSTFDGISTGLLSLKELGYEPIYYASEIEEGAIKVAMKNHPEIIQLGDVRTVKGVELPQIDLLLGGSPCFVEDTLVMTDIGFKKISDIKIGDNVLTHNSRYKKVLNIGNKLVQQTLLVKGTGFDSIETTNEHPFYTRMKYYKWNNDDLKRYRTFKDPVWTNAEDLTPKYYLGHTYNKYDLINSEYNEDFWYFVGRFTADGWIIKTKRKHRKNSYMYKVFLCCGKHEFNDVKDIMDKLNFHYNCSEEKTTYKFYITNEKLLYFLEKINRGAVNKIVHPDLWKLNLKYKKSFLDGYLSGDGHFYKKINKHSCNSISKLLIYGIKQLIMEVYNAPVSIYFNKKSKYAIINGRKVNWNDIYSIHFKKDVRKQDKSFYDNGYCWTQFKSHIKLNNTKIVYNLEVEEDNSYTANGIIVHNCNDLSLQNKDRSGLKGDLSSLFYEYYRLLQEIKPKYFLLENVMMKKDQMDIITSLLGVHPIEINSNLVSAQNRKRLYWTNIPNVTQPTQVKYNVLDFIDGEGFPTSCGVDRVFKRKDIFNTLTATYWKGIRGISRPAVSIREGFLDTDREAHRMLTPTECERLQTVPIGYTDCVAKTNRYKMLGNGWTVDVIAHIFSFLKGEGKFLNSFSNENV